MQHFWFVCIFFALFSFYAYWVPQTKPWIPSSLARLGFGWILLGITLGGKWAHVLLEAKGHLLPQGYFAQNPLELLKADPFHGFRFLESGYVLLGAVLGGLLAFALWVKRFRLFLFSKPLLDHAAAGAALALGIGRLGCFVAGCCYGAPTSLPFGIQHPALHTFVHPTQLYESLFGFVCFLLIRLLPRHRFAPGTIAKATISAYLVFRFVIEQWRGDEERGFVLLGSFILSSSQALILGIGIGGLVLWFFRHGQQKAHVVNGSARM